MQDLPCIWEHEISTLMPACALETNGDARYLHTWCFYDFKYN